MGLVFRVPAEGLFSTGVACGGLLGIGTNIGAGCDGSGFPSGGLFTTKGWVGLLEVAGGMGTNIGAE